MPVMADVALSPSPATMDRSKEFGAAAKNPKTTGRSPSAIEREGLRVALTLSLKSLVRNDFEYSPVFGVGDAVPCVP
jgi:hypothetical protein